MKIAIIDSIGGQSEKMRLLGFIADHPTPKISSGETAYTVNSRDYKGVMIVVLSECNRSVNGEQSSRELLRTGCVQRYVRDGEEE